MDWGSLGRAVVAGFSTVCSPYGQSGPWAAVGAALTIAIIILVALLCFLCGCVTGLASASLWGSGILSHPATKKVATSLLRVPAARRLAALYE